MKDPWVRALVIVTLAIATTHLVDLLWHIAAEFADIILLFFLAWMLAFVIEPTASPLQHRLKIPRVVAIAVTYLSLLVICVLAIVLLIPPLTSQFVQIATSSPVYVDQLGREMLRLQSELEGRGLRWSVDSMISPEELVRRVETAAPPLISNVVGVATGLASLMFQTVIVVVISFYFALDGRRFTDMLLATLPSRFRDDGQYFFESVNRAFAGFLRGQLVLAIVYALGTAVIMRVAELPYGLLTSVSSGVLMLIPFIGPLIALGVPLIIAMISRAEALPLVFIGSIVLQQIVFNIIAPRIMSQSVGLHPLLVLFVVLAGARLAGIWGALFGVPIVAVVSAMVTFYRQNQEDRARQAESLVVETPPVKPTTNIIEVASR